MQGLKPHTLGGGDDHCSSSGAGAAAGEKQSSPKGQQTLLLPGFKVLTLILAEHENEPKGNVFKTVCEMPFSKGIILFDYSAFSTSQGDNPWRHSPPDRI